MYPFNLKDMHRNLDCSLQKSIAKYKYVNIFTSSLLSVKFLMEKKW